MGQRHRETRKVIKLVARRYGMRETELGEIQSHISKAEARRRFIERRWAEHDILREMSARATADIQAIEDARFIAILESATEAARSEAMICRPGRI